MLAALLLGTAGIGVHASAATDSEDTIGVRLLEAPVSRKDDPRARTYIVDHLSPDSTITRRMEVSSTSATAQHVELYAGAATIEGHAFTLAPDRKVNELTTWTSLDTQHVELPPHGRATAEVTIKVPPDASPGERYGVVWAEGGGAPDAPGNIRMVSRVGIRMYLDIGPGGEPASDFQVDNLTPARDADGRPRVTAQVHNTGGRAVDLGGSLSLSAVTGGLTAGPFPVQMGTTLALGDTAPVTVLLDKSLPDGPWKVELKLTSGLIERTVSGTLTFPPPDHIGAAMAPDRSGGWARLPSSALGLGLIPAAGLSVWYLRKRARTRV